jgi:hypothetical protein
MTLPGLVAANNLSDVVDKERAWDNLGSSVSITLSIPSPSLDLNFAANKSLVDDISGNNLITFSRASTGTFVDSNGLIQTAASGVPRFDHTGATGESLGLLVEEARANIFTYSEQFNDVAWTKTNTTILSNVFTAPDGAATADALVESTDAVNTFHRVHFSSATTNGTSYTFSVFARYISRRWLMVTGNRNGWHAFFDIQNGVTGNKGSLVSAQSIQALADGWYKCSATITADATLGSVAFEIASSTVNGTDRSPSYIGNGQSCFHLWGAQLEVGAFPTSYIPTIASTVTRAADVASITGANFSSWYRQDTGSIFVDFTGIEDGSSGNFTTIAYAVTGNTINTPALGFSASSTGSQLLGVYNGGALINGALPSTFTKLKLAMAMAQNSAAFSRNGNTPVTASSLTPRADTDRLLISPVGASGSPAPINGTIARLAYYPVRIPNLALQFITSTSGSPSSTTYPYTFIIKGKDTLALNECKNASVRDFVFIKGLSAPAQPRLTTAAQQVASGTAFQDAAMLKASPTTSGNYLFSSGVTLSGVSTRINNTPALSIATSPFSGSTATASILLRELQPQANWRITEPMPSGTIASPEFAIPFETNDFLLFMKAGQN